MCHWISCNIKYVLTYTAWKVSKDGVFSSPNPGKYGPEKVHIWTLFSSSPGKYGPEKTPYLETFHAVLHTYGTPMLKVLYELTSYSENTSLYFVISQFLSNRRSLSIYKDIILQHIVILFFQIWLFFRKTCQLRFGRKINMKIRAAQESSSIWSWFKSKHIQVLQ